MKTNVAIIGAGPAGLTAAYLLSKNNVPVVVLEADPVYVGGISRTAKYKGFHFDIGGHRFFTKVPGVRELWRELIGDDLLERPRLSRIYYRGRFFDYPLKARNVLANIGPLTGAAVLASYARACLAPIAPERNASVARRMIGAYFQLWTGTTARRASRASDCTSSSSPRSRRSGFSHKTFHRCASASRIGAPCNAGGVQISTK